MSKNKTRKSETRMITILILIAVALIVGIVLYVFTLRTDSKSVAKAEDEVFAIDEETMSNIDFVRVDNNGESASDGTEGDVVAVTDGSASVAGDVSNRGTGEVLKTRSYVMAGAEEEEGYSSSDVVSGVVNVEEDSQFTSEEVREAFIAWLNVNKPGVNFVVSIINPSVQGGYNGIVNMPDANLVNEDAFEHYIFEVSSSNGVCFVSKIEKQV